MKKTPLYERHLALGATMTEFGGWTMPVQYSGVIDEHRNTRTFECFFDVCHMGEIEVRGPQALDLLQWVMSRNLAAQQIGEMKLSAITNQKGGIIDDVTVYKRGEDHYMVVTNAASRHHARVIVSGARIAVEDLGSKNGTWRHGARLTTETMLEDGDEIRFGSFTVTLRNLLAPGATATAKE